MTGEKPADRQTVLYLRQWSRLQRSVATLVLATTEFGDPVAPDTISDASPAETGKYAPTASIQRDEFANHRAVRKLAKSVQSRYWHTGLEEEAHYGREMYKNAPNAQIFNRIDRCKDTLDLDIVIGSMRSIEAGESRMRGFGKGSWNTYAAVINDRLVDTQTNPPLVLPWQQGIHTVLRSWNPDRRQDVVPQLEDLYQQTEAAYAALAQNSTT